MDGVQLKSLRVTADMDVSAYTRAMQEKVAADARGAASSSAVGEALARQDAAAEKTAAKMVALSRQFVNGYGDAARFEKAIRDVGRAFDGGQFGAGEQALARVAVTIEGVYKKFGLFASAQEMAKQGFVSIAPIIEGLNSHYVEQAKAIESVRVANRGLTDDQVASARAAQALANAQAAAARAQADFNSALGISRPSAASQGATTDAFTAQGAAMIAAAEQAGRDANDAFSRSFGIGMRGKVASESGAVFAQELDRLDTIAQQKAAEAGRAFAQDFNASLGIGMRATDSGATYSALTQQLTQQERLERGRMDAIIQSGREQGEANKRAVETENQRAAALKRSVATQDGLNAEIAEFNALQAKGKLTQEEVNLLTIQATKRFTDYQHAMSGVAGTGRRVSNEMTNLSFQLNDVVTGLMLGQSPFMIMAQQGGQVLQILQTGQGGVSGTLKNIGSTLAGMVTPATVAGVSLAAIGGIALIASERWSNAQREISRNLTGLGRDAGVTAAQINEIAEATAKLQGLSAASGRANVGGLAATGRIDPAYLERIGRIQKDLAATLAIDLSEATQLLAGAFADPIRGMEQLNERLGGLDETTRSYIRTQVAAGNEGAAYQRMLDTFTPRLGRASELTSVWAQAWQRLKTISSDTLDAIGRGVQQATTGGGPMTFEQQAQARLASLEASGRGQVVDRATGRDLGNRSTFGQLQEDLQKELDGRQRVNAELAIQRIAMDAIRTGQEAITASTQAMARASYDAGRARRQMDAGVETARRMNIPEQVQADSVAELARNYMLLKAARDAAYPRQGEEGGGERYRAAREAQEAALRALRERLQDRGRGIVNRDGSLAVDLTQQEGMNRLMSSRVTLYDDLAERARVERMEATAVTQAQKVAAAEARARLTAREQGAAAGRQELVDAHATTAAETTRVGIAHQLSEAAKERIRSGQLQIDQLRAETAAMGGSVGTQERVRVEQQLINDAKREYQRLGLSVPPAEIEAYRRLAAAMGEARQAQAELRAQRDIAFERQVIGLSDGEAQIARNLRQIYGDEGWRQQMGGTLAQQARFNDQLKLTNDLAKGFANDFLSGLREGKTLFDALIGAATRLSNRLADMGMERFVQAMSTGQNPFQAMFGGYSGSGSGSFGSSGLMGMSASRLGSLFSTSVSTGMTDALHEMGHGGGASGAAGSSGIFGIGGQQIGGAMMLGGSMLGAYGAGKQGGIGGIASGVMGGAMAGSMALPALMGVTGPVGALIGGALSLVSGIASRLGGNPERDKARQAWLQQAETRDVYLNSLRGNVQGSLASTFAEQTQKIAELSDQASFARQNESVWKDMVAALTKFKQDTSAKFIEPFNSMTAALEAGLGSNSPAVQAHQTIATLREEMLKFIDDTKTALTYLGGDVAGYTERAQKAAQAYALTLLSGAEEQTAVRQEYDRLNQVAISLGKVLQDLGMSANEAATAIMNNLAGALDELRTKTSDDLSRRFNSATGIGYLNDITDALKTWENDLSDAALVGIDKAMVDKTNLAEIQKIVTGARLSGDAFDELMAKFPQLAGVVRQAASTLEDIIERQRGYLDRVFAAGNDTSTLEGQLLAFERAAAREREEEIKAGGEAMVELELALAAERLKVIRDFQTQQTRVLEQAQEAYLSFVRRIKEYTDGLRAGAQSPLSPEARLAAAQSQYDAQLVLAQGGNRDALGGITSYADDLLAAYKAMYASSTAFQNGFNTVISQLEALPTQVSAEQFIVDAINTASAANVSALDAMKITLTASINSGSASATAAALSSYFNMIDSTMDEAISFGEMLSALGSNFNSGTLQSIFAELDGNGNGILEKAELIKAQTAAGGAIANNIQQVSTKVVENTGATNTTTASVDYNNVLATTMNSLLNAFVTAFGTTTGVGSTGSVPAYLQQGGGGLPNLSNPFNPVIQGQAIDLLRKIVLNTYAISLNTFGINNNQVSDMTGVYATGGWVGGNLHSMGGTMIEAERGEYVINRAAASALSPFLDDINRGRLPMMPVPMAGNDNGSMGMIRELQAMRRENAEQRRQIASMAATLANLMERTANASERTAEMAPSIERSARIKTAKRA